MRNYSNQFFNRKNLVIIWHFSGQKLLTNFIWRPPLPFFENRKKCPNFWKKRHYQTDSVYLWVKFKNVVLRVSRRKKSKLFPVRPFFILFLTKFLSKCPDPAKPPLPWNVSDCAPEHILVTWAKLDTSCCHYLPTIKLERDFKEFGCTLFHAASVHWKISLSISFSLKNVFGKRYPPYFARLAYGKTSLRKLI